MNEPLRILGDPESDMIRQIRAARGARIDKLNVDRTAVKMMPLQQCSSEMLEKEGKFEFIRSKTNMAERANAWRKFFEMTLHAS